MFITTWQLSQSGCLSMHIHIRQVLAKYIIYFFFTWVTQAPVFLWNLSASAIEAFIVKSILVSSNLENIVKW